MKYALGLSGFVLALSCSTVNGFAQAGTLDATFSGDGIVSMDVAGLADQCRGVAVQPDGKVVAVGFGIGSGPDIFMVRYNVDGSLDATFDGDGIVTVGFSATDHAYAVLIQPDERIVVAGASSDVNSAMDLLVMRFNSDGSPDASFGGGDGAVITDLSPLDAYGLDVELQPDGQLVVAGSMTGSMFVARYTSGGTLDGGFGTNGWTILTIGTYCEATGCALQADGAIVLSGYSGDLVEDMAVARFTSSGVLDVSFDGDGFITLPLSPDQDIAQDVLVQPDGMILLSVSLYNVDDYDFGLVRLEPDGSFDTTFDGDGILITTWVPGYDSPSTLALQPDGKILQAGTVEGEFAVARYTTGGAVDASFGTGGLATAYLSGDWDYANALALAPDGRIVVLGDAATGDGDLGVVRFLNDITVAVPMNAAEAQACSVHPNPASEQVVLEYAMKHAAVIACEVLDAEGRKVRALPATVRSVGEHREVLDLHGLVAGTYSVVLTTSGRQVASVTVVKQ